MQESHLRSFTKAISWRTFGTLTTMMFTYIITQTLSFTLYIGLFEFVSKIMLYYVHERIWGVIKFGSNVVNDEISDSSPSLETI